MTPQKGTAGRRPNSWCCVVRETQRVPTGRPCTQRISSVRWAHVGSNGGRPPSWFAQSSPALDWRRGPLYARLVSGLTCCTCRLRREIPHGHPDDVLDEPREV